MTCFCLHVNRKAYVACNFNCLIETERLLKVTCSHLHCKNGKSGSIAETVQDRDVITAVEHDQEVICDLSVSGNPMILSDFQGDSPIARIFKWDFSYSCAADLTEITERASCYQRFKARLECGPMPNVIAALSNIHRVSKNVPPLQLAIIFTYTVRLRQFLA